jgi:hypothetical protein
MSADVLMLRRVMKWAGLDGAVIFSLLNKATVIVCSVVTLALVITHFAPELQGYYYTFTSLLVLQTFLELGMGTVLTQFVSHEWSRLHVGTRGRLEGDPLSLDRLGALVGLGLKWYFGASIAFFVLVGTIGTVLLTRRAAPAGVMPPWWLLCAAVSISIFQIPLRSCLEGSNQIARLQRIATAVYAFGAVCGWTAILSGLQLYALAITSGTSAMMGITLLGRACRPFLHAFHDSRGRPASFSWKDEFWPQQWRIALSWICGFFMYQSFVPILFYFKGPITAGQMGASLQVYNAVSSISASWVYAKGPQLGILGASGKIRELQATVRATAVRSTAAASALALAVILGLTFLKWVNYKADRFIGIESIAMLLVTLVILQRTSIETLAVRFQKVEPFVYNSVVSAGLVLASNLLTSKYLGVPAVCACFALIAITIHVPWVHRIYQSFFSRHVT